MNKKSTINFSRITEPGKHGRKIYIHKDSFFSRIRINNDFEDNFSCDTIEDKISNSPYELLFITVSFKNDTILNIEWILEKEISTEDLSIFTDKSLPSKYIVLPFPVMSRSYDLNMRIIKEEIKEFSTSDESIEIKCLSGENIEFPLILINPDYIKELTDFSFTEKLEVKKGSWFHYKGFRTIWKYLINGRIYDPRNEPLGKRWECQQCGHTLYYHTSFLYKKTEKKIYEFLRNIIAWSVLLSLPEDGCWKHGHWTDTMECHTRFQADGVHLILNHYENTGISLFLKKAESAMNYLISISEKVGDDYIWFMHDTLETDKENNHLFYRRAFKTKSFNKSMTNTLCLNTHLWTMSALYRLKKSMPEEKYDVILKKAMKATKMLLKAEPGTLFYSFIYHTRDLMLKLQPEKKNMITIYIQKIFDHFLIKIILPLLKKFFPRILMPDGYIERDLSFAHLSDFYHMQNLKDLIVIYHYTNDQYLLEVIERGIHMTLKTGLMKYLAGYDPQAVMFLDVLAGAARIKKEYFDDLSKYYKFFIKRDLPVSADMVSSPLIIGSIDMTEKDFFIKNLNSGK